MFAGTVRQLRAPFRPFACAVAVSRKPPFVHGGAINPFGGKRNARFQALRRRKRTLVHEAGGGNYAPY